MATISFNVDDIKIVNISQALDELFTNPLINVGTVANPIFEKKYNDIQFIKYCIKNWIIKQVARSNQIKHNKEYIYVENDTLLS